MDMTNLKSGNGYVNKQNLFDRMVRFRPPTDDYFIMAKIKGSDFSQIGVVAYGAAVMPLFKIYTGNEDLYIYIQGMFHEVAKELACKAKSYKWKDKNAHDLLSAEVGQVAG